MWDNLKREQGYKGNTTWYYTGWSERGLKVQLYEMQRKDYWGSVLYVYSVYEKSKRFPGIQTLNTYSITYPLLYQFAFCVVVTDCTKNMDVAPSFSSGLYKQCSVKEV